MPDLLFPPARMDDNQEPLGITADDPSQKLGADGGLSPKIIREIQ